MGSTAEKEEKKEEHFLVSHTLAFRAKDLNRSPDQVSARARRSLQIPLADTPIVSLFTLTLFDRYVQVQCPNPEATALVQVNYGQLETKVTKADLRYCIAKEATSSLFRLTRKGQPSLVAADDGELLFHLEKDLTIELQKMRSDLYFLHAAVLGFRGTACLLVAPSGGGKSLTTWALLHHGFSYGSDELGPVDLNTLTVLPYPHALCLKNVPPPHYPLPAETLFTTRTIHVPTTALPGEVCIMPLPLTAIFFLQYCPDMSQPQLQPMTKAEAGARLFASALNPLVHPGEGLDGAVAIVTQAQCFRLLSADLSSTCAVVKAALLQLDESWKGLSQKRKSKTLG